MRPTITSRQLAHAVAMVPPGTGGRDRTSTAALTAAAPGPLICGTLSVDAHANLGDFTGRTRVLSGELCGGPELGAVAGWVEAPANTLVTGNGRRDADLRRALEAAEFPVLRFELDWLTPTAVVGDSVMVILHGRFIIHGVSREADLPAQVLVYSGGARVWGDASLDLRDYGIRGLRRMLGLIKVHEEVRVQFDLTFATGPGPVRSGE